MAESTNRGHRIGGAVNNAVILLIEDDDADAVLVERALRQCRVHRKLLRARSLTEGLGHLKAQPVSLVLTDLGLPDCGGLDAVARIRASNEDATIIVLSGLEDAETQLDALDHGAQDYLVKNEISAFTLERAIEHGTHRLKNQRRVGRLLNAVKSQKAELERQAKLLDQQNRRLRKLCKTAQQCVNNVSHDFRTPLTVVKEYASLIADGVVGEVQPEQLRMLRVVGDRVDDLNNMVDDMLDISRHNSGLLGANRMPCRVEDVITRLLPGFHQKALLRGITLETQIPSDLPDVFCDAEKVGRVVVNLITNAIKFTSADGAVVVRAEACPTQREVQISVCDNGAGLSEQDCRLIFNRFQQLKSGLQNTTKGFGLGLSIAKELVDLNFGKMSLKSVPGEGSTFSFSIPENDPAVVTERYLQRIKALSRGRAHVSAMLVHADIDGERDQKDVRNFLVYIHRNRDLLLELGRGRWLLLVCAKRDRLPEFLRRIEDEHRSLNRNRPSGPIPDIRLEQLGTHRTGSETAALGNLVRESLTAREVSCV